MKVPTESTPPAQPMKISPSSSESRFSRISPCMKPFCISKAPVRPVSSSRVKRHSMGPCSMLSSANTASPVATPMPLSAPSVVPLAFNHSPSIHVSIGSFKKSCSTSLRLSGTMSIWACKTTVFLFSIPGVAGFSNKTLPQASVVVFKLYFLPNS